jgi:hypothetical protein
LIGVFIDTQTFRAPKLPGINRLEGLLFIIDEKARAKGE